MKDLTYINEHRNNELHVAEKQLMEMLDACKTTRRWVQSLTLDIEVFNVQARNFNLKSLSSKRKGADTPQFKQDAGTTDKTGDFPPDDPIT